MKRITKILCQALLIVVAALAIVVLVDQLFSGRQAKIVVDIAMLTVYLIISNHSAKKQRQRLIQMWAYADQLGYGSDELKRRSQRYGLYGWEGARPEKHQFAPSDKIVSELLAQFEAELAQSQPKLGGDDGD